MTSAPGEVKVRRAGASGGRDERPRSSSRKKSADYHDWQLDSNFDSKNLTTTRDLDNFIATLSGPAPLVQLSEQLRPFAKQMEAEIDAYLKGSNRDMQSKCVIAQEILRHGIERSPELIDELYLQLIKHLQGSNKHTSVRGWELLLLAACASRPTSRYLEPVNNFVHSTSHAKVQWPTTVSILSKRTWTALKHNSKPGRRVNVPSVGEIASVLSSKSMKVQITFVDGSNKWLFYDWTTTVSSAVEQLAAQIGLKNYEEYTLFEVRKIPKKLDFDGAGSIATLPPDSYLLLDDNRRIADVLHDYEVRGAQNKLLLKRKRFDSSEADFSKPQFIALTEAHQAAMDEKVAEVANLTLRLREMSGKVMWFEAQQDEKNAEIEAVRGQLETSEQRASELELKGVSIEARDVLRERDNLAEKVRRLEAEASRAALQRQSMDMEAAVGGDWKPLGLIRKLAEKHEELKRLQAELDTLKSIVAPADVEKAAKIASENASRAADGDLKTDLKEDLEADMSEKEALYDLLRLHTLMEEEHAEEVAAKETEVEHLKQMVEALARRQSKSFSRGRPSFDERVPGSAQQDDSRELRKSLDNGSLSNVAGFKEQLEIATAASMAMEGKITNLQAALEQEYAAKADLEHELLTWKRQAQTKESSLRNQEKEWRIQLSAVRAEAVTVSARLKSRDSALAQATADLDELHKECGSLKTELETKEWELDCANASLASAVTERDAALAALKQIKAQGGAGAAFVTSSGDAGKALQRKEFEVTQLTEQLMEIASERDAALEKLAGIQQLMFGLSQGGVDALNGSSRRTSIDREGKAKNINDNCPLEIGKDPRRESIGGLSAPSHLKGLPPLRVLPEDTRSYGTRHPLFAPSYVNPMLAATPDKQDSRSVRREAAALINAADARRRLFKRQGPATATDRPAPQVMTTPRMTDRINTGTHLLGLLSNAAITRSHDSLGDAEDNILASGGARDDVHGYYSADILKTNSSMASQDIQGKLADFPRGQRGSASGYEGRQIMTSGGSLSTQSESDIRRAYDGAMKAED